MKLSSVDLNLLHVLHVVLEERSVTRAAKQLHVTPPAVSNALARLRELLGDPLLVRTGRSLTPTPFALALRPKLQDGLQALEQVIAREPAFEPGKVARTFTVVCTDVDQLSLMPRVARDFAARLPRSVLHVMSVDTFEALGGLARAEVDAVIAPPQPPAPGVHAEMLCEDDAVLVLRRGHPAARGKMTRERFNALRHIDIHVALGERGRGNRKAEEMLRRHGLVRNVAAVVPGFSAALMLAAATDLAAGVPRRIASALADALRLTLLDFPGPPFSMELQLHWHERTHNDEGSRYFRQLILDAARGGSGV